MIFVDTSFWVAAISERDANHEKAVHLLQTHGDKHLMTSNHVCGESWTFLRRRYGHGAAVRFADRIRRSTRVRVAFVSEPLEEQAWSWLRRRDEREYSFVDAASFVLMRSLRIREVLTFDEDFDAAGFVRLRGSKGD